MSVCGHFRKRDEQALKMPRSDGQPDELGIRYEGDVLNGRLSVEDAQLRDKMSAATEQMRRNPRGPTYVRPEDYDPVLRFHLGMEKPYYFLKEEEEKKNG